MSISLEEFKSMSVAEVLTYKNTVGSCCPNSNNSGIEGTPPICCEGCCATCWLYAADKVSPSGESNILVRRSFING